MSYYTRRTRVHTDGTPLFKTAADKRLEQRVSRRLARAWKCRMTEHGELAAVDRIAVRHERPVAVVEIKGRSHPAARYPTVFLNVRKYQALRKWGRGLGVPALYVVCFQDEIRWIDVREIEGAPRIGGCRKRVKSQTDVELVYHVPIRKMHRI